MCRWNCGNIIELREVEMRHSVSCRCNSRAPTSSSRLRSPTSGARWRLRSPGKSGSPSELLSPPRSSHTSCDEDCKGEGTGHARTGRIGPRECGSPWKFHHLLLLASLHRVWMIMSYYYISLALHGWRSEWPTGLSSEV
jgi:hypothetical protein